MKKLVAFVISILLVMGCYITASADYTHIDPDYGTTFSIPDNYHESELNADRQYIDVKFESNDGLSSIMYGSTDVFAELDKEGLYSGAREDLSDDCITDSDMESILGDLDGIDIEKISLGNNNYYLMKTTSSYTVGGYEISFDYYVASYIENGVMFQFYFTDMEGGRYQEFQDLLAGVTFPKITSSGTPATPSPVTTLEPSPVLRDSTPQNSTGSTSPMIYILIGVVIAIILLSSFLLLRNKKKSEKSSENSFVTPTATQIRFCRMCGKQLPEGSKFCQYCGNKLY